MTIAQLHEISRLPACFIEDLLANNMRPPVEWASEFQKIRMGRQYLRVFRFLPRELPSERLATAHVCYHTTVIFYDRAKYRNGEIEELARVDLNARTYPRISFVEHEGELWEVNGGSVEWDRHVHRWVWLYHCYRNTDWSRHFRGLHGWEQSGCIPCRQIAVLAENTVEVAG